MLKYNYFADNLICFVSPITRTSNKSNVNVIKYGNNIL